ncbi:hypothetical protein GCK32_011515 [Trichostrongylus colubriformis]|uniref:Uncharacterized protein n=1 Tax=Trichostrongylus colubriformis TaxID=6319 RepID=A0AAN8FS20_TRICO
MLSYTFVVLTLLGSTTAKDISRAKRQTLGYYLCGTSSNGSNSFILSNSYYSPLSSNCQTACSNINCNQYNGQYNGQYIIAYVGGGQYDPCASSCCGGSNTLNNWPTLGNGYYNPYATNVIGNGVSSYINTNPLTQVGPGPVIISNGIRRSPLPAAFTGTISNGVLLCGGNEPAGGYCSGNGQCPSGHVCVAGNVCCRCAVGASSGTCPSGNDSECPVGYGCAVSLNCCPTEIRPGQGLSVCGVNGDCEDGFECGKGNLCYPIG